MKIKDFIKLNYEKFDFVKDSIESRINFIQNNNRIKNKDKYINKLNELYSTYEDNKIHTFIKYLKYKINPCDPDSYSNLLQDIYKLLWKDEYLNRKYMKSDINRFYSDTLTSAQTRINDYLKYLKKENKKIPQHTKKQFSPKVIYEDLNNNDDFKKYIINDNDKLFINMHKFVSVYHTLGNYCPVPRGFNISRSGYYANKDYADIMLMKIKEYYDTDYIDINNNDFKCNSILELLNYSEYKYYYISCIQWLNSFGKGREGWKNFVNNNYFKGSFVDDDYNVVLLANHTWNNPKIPDDEYDYFFAKTSECIVKRSNIMFKEINKKFKKNI